MAPTVEEPQTPGTGRTGAAARWLFAGPDDEVSRRLAARLGMTPPQPGGSRFVAAGGGDARYAGAAGGAGAAYAAAFADTAVAADSAGAAGAAGGAGEADVADKAGAAGRQALETALAVAAAIEQGLRR